MWDDQKESTSSKNKQVFIPEMPLGIRVIKVKNGKTIPENNDDKDDSLEKSENFDIIKIHLIVLMILEDIKMLKKNYIKLLIY